MKISLLTFGAGHPDFINAANHLEKQALESRIFNRIYNLSSRRLIRDLNFQKNYKEFVKQNSKGYGYWIWKPYLIYRYLNKINNDDLLIYLDAGCYLNLSNSKSKSTFSNYLNIAFNNYSLAGQIKMGEWGQENLTELAWTRLKVIETVELSNKDKLSNQIQAGWQIYRKTPENLNFVREWLELCVSNNFELLVDAPKNEVNHRSFIEHRHDQSIFSCLYKKNNKFFIQDNTWWDPNWNSDGENYPIWAMRASRKLEFIRQSKI